MCNWLPADACALSSCPACITNGCVSNSLVWLAAKLSLLNKLKMLEDSTNVISIVGVAPVSSDTNIDFNNNLICDILDDYDI